MERSRFQTSFEDDGEGIRPEDLPMIFERFYAGRDGRSCLGLAITKEIARLPAGSLKTENAEKGAVFTLSLPDFLATRP